MKFEKGDLTHCQNLVRALTKAKFEVEGLEVLALADVYKWVSNLQRTIEQELAAPPIKVEQEQITVTKKVK
jgi:hypothetical protein